MMAGFCLIFTPPPRLWVNGQEGTAMLNIYIMVFGAFLLFMGGIEVLAPLRVLSLWQRWIGHRLFFLHGAVLIATGLPLTCAGGSTTGRIIFYLGLLLVFAGPFILVYADRVRALFLGATSDLDSSAARRLILFDAVLRIVAGLLMVYSSASSFGF